MKSEKQKTKIQDTHSATQKRGRWRGLFFAPFGRSGQMPKRTAAPGSLWKPPIRRLFWLVLLGGGIALIVSTCRRSVSKKMNTELQALAYDHLLFRHADCDFVLYRENGMCSYPSVLMADYRNYQEQEGQARLVDQEAAPGPQTQAKNYIRQRPKVNVDRLVYYERLTQDKVRLIYDNGACEIFNFENLLFNIQEYQDCGQFPGIPDQGEVYEYVNLLYIESFDKVICDDQELYRIKLGVDHSSCSALRSLEDCGVGLFSFYVYRQLRKKLEELNPHSSFKYRRTVELVGCDC